MLQVLAIVLAVAFSIYGPGSSSMNAIDPPDNQGGGNVIDPPDNQGGGNAIDPPDNQGGGG